MFWATLVRWPSLLNLVSHGSYQASTSCAYGTCNHSGKATSQTAHSTARSDYRAIDGFVLFDLWARSRLGRLNYILAGSGAAATPAEANGSEKVAGANALNVMQIQHLLFLWLCSHFADACVALGSDLH